jgi:hypothetical protein
VANEPFARIKIDQLLKDIGWKLTDGISIRFEYALDDGGRADYALFDRQGRALAVLEARLEEPDSGACKVHHDAVPCSPAETPLFGRRGFSTDRMGAGVRAVEAPGEIGQRYVPQ